MTDLDLEQVAAAQRRRHDEHRERLAVVIHDTTGRVPWDYASTASKNRAYRIADAVLDLGPPPTLLVLPASDPAPA